MITFKYSRGKSSRNGTIRIISAEFPFEAEIVANGWDFHIIVGKYKSGHFICIPNWDIGSELSSLDDFYWNNERLLKHTNLGKMNSHIIASALKELSTII